MLKIRIIAGVIAILLTALTIYLIPIVVNFYKDFTSGLNQEQQVWLIWLQAGVGFSVAMCAFWFWKKKGKSEK